MCGTGGKSKEILATTGSPLHRENREIGQRKVPVREHREFGNFCQNTENFVCSSFKFPASKDKDIAIFGMEMA